MPTWVVPLLPNPHGGQGVITVHPSYLLRLQEERDKRRDWTGWSRICASPAKAARKTTPLNQLPHNDSLRHNSRFAPPTSHALLLTGLEEPGNGVRAWRTVTANRQKGLDAPCVV